MWNLYHLFVTTVISTVNLVPWPWVTPTPIPTVAPIINQATPSSTPIPVVYLTGQGEYSIIGQKINYEIKMPKSGGSVTGEISGMCKAPITGTYDGGEGGKIHGNTKVKCTVLFSDIDGEAEFTGNVFPNKEKVDFRIKGKFDDKSFDSDYSIHISE